MNGKIKKGEIVWDKLGKWILLLALLISVLVIIYFKKESLLDAVESIKTAFRFGH